MKEQNRNDDVNEDANTLRMKNMMETEQTDRTKATDGDTMVMEQGGGGRGANGAVRHFC